MVMREQFQRTVFVGNATRQATQWIVRRVISSYNPNPMDWQPHDFRKTLREIYTTRLARNASYSLRAFARDIGMSASHLNEVLNRHSGISPDRVGQICERLGFNGTDRELAIASTGAFCARAEEDRKKFWRQVRRIKLKQQTACASEIDPTFNLNGIWRVEIRMGSSGGNPLEWQPLHESQHFEFTGSEFRFHQNRIAQGQSMLNGNFELDKGLLITPTRYQQTTGRIWLAAEHRVKIIGQNRLYLSTAPIFFARSICEPGDALETIWVRE